MTSRVSEQHKGRGMINVYGHLRYTGVAVSTACYGKKHFAYP